MTVEQCKYELEWQPMMLGTTKEERMTIARKNRKIKQLKREERVLFLQSMLFMFCMSVTAVGVLIAGACL